MVKVDNQKAGAESGKRQAEFIKRLLDFLLMHSESKAFYFLSLLLKD